MPSAGRGEDSPIFEERSRRDGWGLLQQGTWLEQRKAARLWFRCDPPEIWSKPHPLRSLQVRLLRYTEGINEKDGPWYVTSYRLDGGAAGDGRDIGRADWADWASNGDLLFADEDNLVVEGVPGICFETEQWRGRPGRETGDENLDAKITEILVFSP